ncbi:hypothetical protein M407DRAFT_27182 [Tulasnella calospora MUT 4182]|uniref:Uncharacterized protein n=1 Tax=Tulasnella calospora MUT 4182 TaxID=1051891 RepID=A0A0C3QED5_9AGAM|nr:hypothetical protein M407DRAFT_27182 [Tulasnella calospora MUT 4182]
MSEVSIPVIILPVQFAIASLSEPFFLLALVLPETAGRAHPLGASRLGPACANFAVSPPKARKRSIVQYA